MDECCSNKGREIAALAAQAGQRRVLQIVLMINAVMFLIEFTGGVIAGSSALMADSVDMLCDAFVYVLSLFALSRGPRWEAGAGVAKGVIILCFAMAVVVEVVLKVLYGVPPSSLLMLIFGTLALAEHNAPKLRPNFGPSSLGLRD